MSSPSVLRWKTKRELDRRIAARKPLSAIYAAYARAFVAWGGRIRPAPIPEDTTHEEWCRIAHAYTTAQLRAYGTGPHDNRHQRRHKRGT